MTMIKIRLKTFETNSSSTHSIVVLNENEQLLFNKNELYIDPYSKDFKNKDEYYKDLEKGFELYNEDNPENVFKNLDEFLDSDFYYNNKNEFIVPFEEYLESEDLEVDRHEYITPKGEKILIVCRYGYGYGY